MTRISSSHHNNFEPRTPNYGFHNSEEISVSGESIVASSIFGPPITKKNVNDPTNIQSLPKVDTSNIKINSKRRRFFEDQYHWVTDRFVASAFDAVKYLGSGTIASNEVSSFIVGGQNALAPSVADGGRYESLYQNWIDNYGSWLPDFRRLTTSKTVGGNIKIFENNNITTVENLGNMVDRWVCKVREGDRDIDSVIVVVDGPDYGRQSYGDYQVIETLGLLKDILGNIGYQVNSELYFSSIEFVPPLPYTYHNPICTGGIDVYTKHLGQTGADFYFPEYWLNSAIHKIGMPYYTHIAEDSSSLTIDTCFYTVDFGGELRGGDAVSGAASVSAYWDSNGEGTGFLETPANTFERGTVHLRQTHNNGYQMYNKKHLNYGGTGVHREVFGMYQSSEFGWRNYVNSDLYQGDTKLTDKLKNTALSVMGNFIEANHANAGYATTNMLIGGYLDPRFNEIYLYSPETQETVTFSDIVVETAVMSDGTTLNVGGDTPLYFTCSPESPSIVPSNPTISYTRINGDISNDNNRMIVTQYVTSGTDTKVLYRSVFTPSDTEYIDSNKILAIVERKLDNPGGLSSVAVGRYAVLDTDKEPNVIEGWRSLNTVNITLGNHLTSGSVSSDTFGNAIDTLYTIWGADGDAVGDELSNSLAGTTLLYFASNNNAYIPEGWNMKHCLLIVGEDKDDVINKLETYLSNNSFEEIIYPENELPESVLNYYHPKKGGNIY